ncbi:MAG: efflux RND transporter periplasmic adaptor subunit, partial [Aeoliella sp.]
MNSLFQLANSRRGSLTLLLAAALVVTLGLGGFLLFRQGAGSQVDTKLVLHRIERGDFELTITERGEIESAGVTEVRSEVKTKNQPGLAILRVVAEGAQVKAGDFLVELDSSALEAERILQQNLVNVTEALVVETRNLYETALIAKEEYVDGTYVQERQTIEGEAFVAEENLNRAKEYYLFSKKLAAKGHVNELQLEADRFAIEKSEKELEAARTKLRVLDDYTLKKMAKQFESDIVITEAKWGSAKKSYELELKAFQEIEDQIAKCTIVAPKDSVVIYANDRDRHGNDDWVVEEGAVVRERQVIFRLPDSGAMRVELKINEALVQYVKPKMPASIVPIGVDGAKLKGSVISINDYAEPSNWRKADVKEYKAFVAIDERATQLRSGMTVSVTVTCDFVSEALQVPVQAVHAHGGDYYCFVRKDGAWEARQIECGATNSEFFVIDRGLEEGEQVVMNPRRYLDEV